MTAVKHRFALPVVFLLLLVIGTRASGQSTQQTPQQAPKTTLRQELLDRMAEDQRARKQLLDLMSQERGPNTDAIEIQTRENGQKVDKQNTARMKEIVRRYGWPGKTLVGPEAAHAAWLLVQHADSDPAFQKRCLALITEAVKKGEVPAEQMAYLMDRVRIAEKQKQVYGTQFHDENGRMEPQSIEDEANVDRRRREVGLPPLAEYRKSIEAMYGPGKPPRK
jgi:hypothetical protein